MLSYIYASRFISGICFSLKTGRLSFSFIINERIVWEFTPNSLIPVNTGLFSCLDIISKRLDPSKFLGRIVPAQWVKLGNIFEVASRYGLVLCWLLVFGVIGSDNVGGE